MKILNELREVYKQEWWHDNKLSDEELDKYHSHVIKTGNLLYVWDNGLLAYIEYWKVNKEQLADLLKNNTWSPCDNDVTRGDICYVANIWIKPEHRKDKKFDNTLKSIFFQKNKDCKLFVWERKKRGKTSKLFSNIRRY